MHTPPHHHMSISEEAQRPKKPPSSLPEAPLLKRRHGVPAHSTSLLRRRLRDISRPSHCIDNPAVKHHRRPYGRLKAAQIFGPPRAFAGASLARTARPSPTDSPPPLPPPPLRPFPHTTTGLVPGYVHGTTRRPKEGWEGEFGPLSPSCFRICVMGGISLLPNSLPSTR